MGVDFTAKNCCRKIYTTARSSKLRSIWKQKGFVLCIGNEMQTKEKQKWFPEIA